MQRHDKVFRDGKIRSDFMIFLSLLVSFAAYAEVESGAKIGLVQMQKAISSVSEGKKAQETLKKEYEERQKKLQAEGKKIQDSMEELRKQAMVLDDKTRREREEGIQANIMKLRELEARQGQEFQKRDLEVSEPIIKKIRTLVAQVAKEKGYNLVIDGNESTVIFAMPKDDITDEVIKRYDAKK